jgi:hypothetical protein
MFFVHSKAPTHLFGTEPKAFDSFFHGVTGGSKNVSLLDFTYYVNAAGGLYTSTGDCHTLEYCEEEIEADSLMGLVEKMLDSKHIVVTNIASVFLPKKTVVISGLGGIGKVTEPDYQDPAGFLSESRKYRSAHGALDSLSKRQTVHSTGSVSGKFRLVKSSGRTLLYTNEDINSLSWTSVDKDVDLWMSGPNLSHTYHRVDSDMIPAGKKVKPFDGSHFGAYIISLSTGDVGTSEVASPAYICRLSNIADVYFVGDMTVRYGFNYKFESKQRTHNVEFLGYVEKDPKRRIKKHKQKKGETDIKMLFDYPEEVVSMVDANVARNKCIEARAGFTFRSPGFPKLKKVGIVMGMRLRMIPVKSVVDTRCKATTIKSKLHLERFLNNPNRRLKTINKTKHCGPYNWVLNTLDSMLETDFQNYLRNKKQHAKKINFHAFKSRENSKDVVIRFDVAQYPHYPAHPSCEHIDFAFRSMFGKLTGTWDNTYRVFEINMPLGSIHERLLRNFGDY